MKTRNRNTMKLLFTFLLMLTAAQMNAQFNNSWIDYNKTYYKFKVGATGLYRINYSSLVSMGWETIPAEQFQLWRNGQQVPIYTSAGTGPLGPSDYIEFWGERNDGKPDKVLYRDPIFQHTDKISLQTDTAAFFLTVNSSGNNLRLTPTVNNLGGTLPPAEPYFMHKAEIAFNTKINNGKAAVIGEYVYSSSYDQGEMYTSRDIDSIPSNALVQNFTNLFVYNGGPAAKLRLGVCGNALNNRRVNVELNGNLLIDKPLIEFADSVYTVPSVPLSMINSGTASVRVINVATRYTDRMSVSFIELTYPRQFNFGGAKNFEFSLPASLSGNYLEITGFAYGAVAPVLYDLTNGKRYVGNISTPGTVKIMLEPSPTERKLLLVNQESSNYVAVNNFQQRKFIDYYSSDNQGDYIIISNKRLYGGANGNQVERYRQYRSSTVGGGFSAKIYDIDELEDQFAFGIRMHPLSVKDFLRFARANFAVKPKYVFIIGRGVVYNSFRPNQSNPEMASLCLVPTFGYPGSDNMLATDNGYTAVPLTPIGRLSVVTPAEIQNYLDKVIEYEMIQRTPSCNIADKAWMKNVVQVTGASDAYLGTVLCNYMQGYKNIISDSVFGAKVTTFCKTTTTTAQEIATGQLSKLFEEGISVLTYFGHSSASVLEFSISDPENYNNAGKYPVFYVNGCNAGNFFSYDLTRLGANKTLSEKFMLAKDRGTIGFVASTHYGIVNYLNIFVDGMYRLITRPDYGKTLGEIQRDAMQRIINVAGPEDFYARAHAEQITLHGDPYIRINTHDKPDYAINEAQIKVNPNFLTIAEDKFTINAKIFNLGKTSGDSIKINIIRTLPDNTTDTLYSQKVPPIGSQDSIILNVPIIATRDKGINKITVTVDADNVADELCENNNMVVKELVIYEDDARPVYPYNFAIVNQQLNKLTASTSNPFGKPLRYRMEIDTTENFNSPLLRFQEVTASGGLLEFDPGLQFQDSVVYYWRTALVPTGNQDYQWSTASFIYLPSSTTGWNQSHFYQMQRNEFNNIFTDDERKLAFEQRETNLRIDAGVYPYFEGNSYLDDNILTSRGCGDHLNSITFVAVNKITGKAIPNLRQEGNKGTYNSVDPRCSNNIDKKYLFDYFYNQQSYRHAAANFFDSLPNNTIIGLWNYGSVGYASNPRFIDEWQNDTLVYGPNKSLYHKFKEAGFTLIDSFYRNVPFIAIIEKDENGQLITREQHIGSDPTDFLEARYYFDRYLTNGTLKSMTVGPANEWKSIHWKTSAADASESDSTIFRLYGVRSDFSETLLYQSQDPAKDTTLDFVDAVWYPRLRLEYYAVDEVNHTPRMLDYWQIKYDEIPEGALSANLFFQNRDTVEVGETIDFKIAFKNISQAPFDSLKLKMIIIDQHNVTHVIDLPRAKPLMSGDTVLVSYLIDTKKFPGNNTLYLEVNGDGDQVEQHYFNNFLYREIYVKPDYTQPLLDVTFDGVHILNRDIVSSKPHIMIKLKDDAKYMPLTDTAGISVQLRYMENGGWTRKYSFDGDTLRFTPPANSLVDNTATIDFLPHLLEDGEYELTVSGNDMSENAAGSLDYRVVFQVYNKPMISNMLNYPNPFTTSTAFVFTITGEEVPQNLKIQILTVTGKVVREITKNELGPLRVGRNITEYKWDGTDQFGQKLGNGIYLYRVVTNLNGKSLDKFQYENDKTDKYFRQGYGKMYLMR